MLEEAFVGFTRKSVRRFVACFVFRRDNLVVDMVLFRVPLEFCDLGSSLASFLNDPFDFFQMSPLAWSSHGLLCLP